ncbi:MAG: hypothetical protein ABSG25_01465 [Bryobacteraceae bacterium]
MATNKYLALNGDTPQQVAFTVTSAGSANGGQGVATDATGHLDPSVMPIGVAPETDQIVASENLTAGAFVNLWTNSGVINARNADNTTSGKEANGFVLSGYTSSQTATVYRIGQSNTQLTGLTPGAKYYLGTIGGTISSVSGLTTGNIMQFVGKAISATEIEFIPGQPIII